MKNHLFKTAKFVLGFAALVFVLAGMFGFIDVSWLVGSGTVTYAVGAGAAAVSSDPISTEVTSAKSTSLLTNTIDKKITLMRPDRYPFDTILREMGMVVPVKSWVTEYYEVEDRDIEDTVQTTLAASGTTSSATKTHALVVDKVHIWQIDDNILVHSVNGSDSLNLILNVVGRDATTDTLTVIALNGIGDNGTDVPEIAADVKLTFIGNAKSELDSVTSPYATFPQKQQNYNQIHMAQVEQGEYEKLHDKEVAWNLADYQSSALFTMRGSMEFTSLFGYGMKRYDPVGEDYKYFSNGALRYITNVKSVSASGFDNSSWVDIAKDAFSDNNGSDMRVIFAGSGARATFAKAPTITKQMEQRDVEVKWGIRFNRVETDFGTFLVKLHKGLDKVGWTNNAFILDMANIQRHVFKPLATKNIDFDKIGTRKSTANIIDEAFCTVYKNPDSHRILKLT